MKIAIIGPGAVGTAIASALDTLDVTLLGRQDKVMTFEERDTGERKSIPVKIASALDTLDVTLLGRQDKVMTFEERDTGERKSIPVKSFMRSNAFSFSAS